MPGPALIATQLTDRSTRFKTLTVGGVDVPVGPVTGSTVFVDVATLELVEAGPGSVSSLKFTIADAAAAMRVTDGAEVQFYDVERGGSLFVGWVQSWKYTPWATTGRWIEVQCIGAEALLDWAIVPAMTITAGTDALTAVQAVVAASLTRGPLRAFGSGAASTQANPVGPGGAFGATLDLDVTTTDGTLREALRQVLASLHYSGGGQGPLTATFTVDTYFGLRVWPDADKPSDWTELTVVDTVAGSIASSELKHETDATGITRAVYITGGNAAGTGLVSAGTGKIGQTAQLSDDTILTTAARDAVGAAYLASFAIGVRGELVIGKHTPVLTVHPGSSVTITDAAASLTVQPFVISQITKRFYATPARTEYWQVAYGGLPPSMARLIRRHTRVVRA